MRLYAKRGNKFRAKKVVTPEHTFDSQVEYMRYCQLKILQKAGEIKNLTIEPKFSLDVNGHHICKYTADFSYTDLKSGQVIIEDVKGGKATETRDFKLRKKLMLAIHGIEIKIVKFPS